MGLRTPSPKFKLFKEKLTAGQEKREQNDATRLQSTERGLRACCAGRLRTRM
jgi:5'-3' exonuclease